jgi:FkbM family methyltransferase
MHKFEMFVSCLGRVLGFGRWPVLHQLAGLIATGIYSLISNCVYRNLGNKVEVKILPRLRYISEQYERDTMELICRILREGDTAIDIGANIGLYSLLMGKLVEKSGKVYSFEPASNSFEVLIEHLKLNLLDNVVEPHQKLVGSKSCAQIFIEDGLKGTNRIGGSRFDGPKATRVERDTTTLDEFLNGRARSPKVIKIDVEGFELPVLQGARRTLTASGCTVFCEMHPDLWNEVGHSWLEIEGFIREINYEMFDLSGNTIKNLDLSERTMVILRPALQ